MLRVYLPILVYNSWNYFTFQQQQTTYIFVSAFENYTCSPTHLPPSLTHSVPSSLNSFFFFVCLIIVRILLDFSVILSGLLSSSIFRSFSVTLSPPSSFSVFVFHSLLQTILTFLLPGPFWYHQCQGKTQTMSISWVASMAIREPHQNKLKALTARRLRTNGCLTPFAPGTVVEKSGKM